MSSVRSEAKTFSVSHTVIASSSTSHPASLSRPVVSTVQRLLWMGNLLYYQLLAILTAVLLWVFFENTDLNQPILWHMAFSTIAVSRSILTPLPSNQPSLFQF